MNVKRRTQADRTAATRSALIGAARPLFATQGFGRVGTEQIVSAAGLTRGALYHQFADKAELFAAVLEAVEIDVTARIAATLGDIAPGDPVALLVAGADAWLDACAEPEVQQIVLLDGPAVLGWERWRDVGLDHGLGLVSAVLREAIGAGTIPEQPVEPLAHVLVGALDEAALYVARADDQVAAGVDVRAVLRRLISAVLTSG